ncbi:restriction endonuclease subunit R [Leptolyngbya sp. NIES-2104]|uniref:restriction endonuclease subunit R n=1 Tax=Leptolyngbya sp. NIES-2104 TaxID=1552121 RepID=UPI0006EC6D1F|nr:restriction endonuclease subunit R [Leptolyngbya sp. NIES-2104]GAP98793.1 hypothetical protein NIES2104_53490 [Leptolyngbya sp. NIES-2104]
MTIALDASNLTLDQVHRLLKLQLRVGQKLTSLLTLEELTESERQKLTQIRENFITYYGEGKILEGQIQYLFLSPLMWLAGFHNPRIRLDLEVGISSIEVEDEDTLIKGRMDILAAKRMRDQREMNVFWVLIVEAKNSSLEASEGLPQLLTYAFTGLEQQQAVWGLTTNGLNYQFVRIEQGEPPPYTLFPTFNMLYPDQVEQLLQVMKAICEETRS